MFSAHVSYQWSMDIVFDCTVSFRYHLDFQLCLVSMSWWRLCWYSGLSPLYWNVMWPWQGYIASHYRWLAAVDLPNPTPHLLAFTNWWHWWERMIMAENEILRIHTHNLQHFPGIMAALLEQQFHCALGEHRTPSRIEKPKDTHFLATIP